MMDNTFETSRKQLYKQQTALRELMADAGRFDEAMALFLQHHAQLHTGQMANAQAWSFADAVLGDVSDAIMRRIPQNQPHSIAWCVWHIARIEDATMNLLVAGEPQVLRQQNWLAQMNVAVQDTGNGMSDADIAQFSAAIDTDALLAYRMAVGQRTREIITSLDVAQLQQKVDPERMQRLLAEGVLRDNAGEVAEYWSSRTIAGLLLMPATRHSLIHLNESLQLKKKGLTQKF